MIVEAVYASNCNLIVRVLPETGFSFIVIYFLYPQPPSDAVRKQDFF